MHNDLYMTSSQLGLELPNISFPALLVVQLVDSFLRKTFLASSFRNIATICMLGRIKHIYRKF